MSHRLIEDGSTRLLEDGGARLLETATPARRIFHEGVLFRPTHRPYQGGIGASLYAAAVDPNADPGPRAIEFRRNRTFDGADGFWPQTGTLYDLGATPVVKSPRLASVETPETEIVYPIPAGWHNKRVHLQVRPFEADRENETLYRPRSVLLDGSGDEDGRIGGSARVTATEKRDGGGLRVLFSYARGRRGTTPTGFVLRKMTGAGTIADGTAIYVPPTGANPLGQRLYEISVTGLTNAVAYTFDLLGTDGTTETVLVAGIAFTGDAAGPSAVSGLVAVEV